MGVYMAMQYGEGSGAFMRLQEAISQDNNDQTLFAWHYVPRTLSKICEQTKHSLVDVDDSPQSSASLEFSSEASKKSEGRKSQMDQMDQDHGFYLDKKLHGGLS